MYAVAMYSLPIFTLFAAGLGVGGLTAVTGLGLAGDFLVAIPCVTGFLTISAQDLIFGVAAFPWIALKKKRIKISMLDEQNSKMLLDFFVSYNIDIFFVTVINFLESTQFINKTCLLVTLGRDSIKFQMLFILF